MEQSFIAYIMSYSGCIGPAATHNDACKYQSIASLEASSGASLQSQSALINRLFQLLSVLLALLAKLM